MDAAQYITENNIKFIKIGIFDLHGIIRGKVLSQAKFLKCLEHGMGFCDVIIGSDSDDQLIDNMKFTGWHTAYPDAELRIIPESMRILPWEPDSAFFLCEFAPKHDQVCSRAQLRKACDKAAAMGFNVVGSMEFEFSVFQETPDSLYEKGFKQLTPLTPGNFGYSVLRSSQTHDLYDDLLTQLSGADIDIECLHTEIGPGVLEAAITYGDITKAADNAALFKLFTKVILHQNLLTPTFMAKYNTIQQGHSGHIHMSLRDQKNKPVFYDDTQPHNMSKLMQHFVAGQQALMPELLSLSAPNINSFARLVPGHWAPTSATWGVDNRTTALRVVPGSASSQRVEYRIPGADASPHLAMAAALASGLYGIENKLELDQPMVGNAYTQDYDKFILPKNLTEASSALRQSTYAQDLWGADFVDNYCALKEWEARQYQMAVTDWQLKRYFEII
ncbi:MAG: glutamine synthetase [Coxiella sp. (in: Bacteria)]|nr:MAG: glutamine synthetase [Coxiella sp. (in: g-proteobacteria)]